MARHPPTQNPDQIARLVDEGGCVYPAEVKLIDGTLHSPGMTLRQHYAGLAMQGMLASGITTDPHLPEAAHHAWLAKRAARQADAMLKEVAP
ncbi:MAG: hypothetical protein GY788_11495 [bacterium]|nr:hypothetical protein [bacterium]